MGSRRFALVIIIWVHNFFVDISLLLIGGLSMRGGCVVSYFLNNWGILNEWFIFDFLITILVVRDQLLGCEGIIYQGWIHSLH